MRYIVPDGFCPWVRGGCIACSRGRGGLRCGEDVYPSNRAGEDVYPSNRAGEDVYPSNRAGEDVYPSNRAQRTVEILQLSYF